MCAWSGCISLCYFPFLLHQWFHSMGTTETYIVCKTIVSLGCHIVFVLSLCSNFLCKKRRAISFCWRKYIDTAEQNDLSVGLRISVTCCDKQKYYLFVGNWHSTLIFSKMRRDAWNFRNGIKFYMYITYVLYANVNLINKNTRSHQEERSHRFFAECVLYLGFHCMWAINWQKVRK